MRTPEEIMKEWFDRKAEGYDPGCLVLEVLLDIREQLPALLAASTKEVQQTLVRGKDLR